MTQCSIGFDIVSEEYVVSPDGQTCTWTIKAMPIFGEIVAAEGQN